MCPKNLCRGARSSEKKEKALTQRAQRKSTEDTEKRKTGRASEGGRYKHRTEIDMIRSKMRMGISWAIVAIALYLWPGVVKLAHGQGSRKGDIVLNTRGGPLAGATVRVCAMPANGQPCAP